MKNHVEKRPPEVPARKDWPGRISREGISIAMVRFWTPEAVLLCSYVANILIFRCAYCFSLPVYNVTNFHCNCLKESVLLALIRKVPFATLWFSMIPLERILTLIVPLFLGTR